MKKINVMRKMRLKGETLQKIGNKFNLTRERVRQILAENYGEALSSARGLTEYLRNEIMDYQWDSNNALNDSLIIARRIENTLSGVRKTKIDKNDPLLILFKV